MAKKSNGAISLKRLDEQTIVEYTLSEEYTQKFNDLLKDEATDPYQNWEHYKIVGKAAITKVLPANLIKIMSNMRSHNQPTALIVHGMPVDLHIPQTPRDGNRPPIKGDQHGKGYVSETSILGVCSLLQAFPDFDEREKDGTYINQIIPRDDAKSKAVASSFGSETPFHVHTENVYQEPPLKFFSLTALRGDPKVATNIVFLDHILHYIKNNPLYLPCIGEWVIDEMQKPQFIMKSGPSFENSQAKKILPILTRSKNGERVFRFNANPERVSGTNEVAQFVVEHLQNMLTSPGFLEKYKTSVFLKKGDFLLFNNWEVMHARDAFKIDKDNWRWLQRCYFMLEEHRQ